MFEDKYSLSIFLLHFLCFLMLSVFFFLCWKVKCRFFINIFFCHNYYFFNDFLDFFVIFQFHFYFIPRLPGRVRVFRPGIVPDRALFWSRLRFGECRPWSFHTNRYCRREVPSNRKLDDGIK